MSGIIESIVVIDMKRTTIALKCEMFTNCSKNFIYICKKQI